METVLVTGAAGFIGSHLSKALLAEGYSVVGVDNFDPVYERSFKEEHLAPLLGKEGFRFVELDIRDRAALLALFADTKPTLVAHLAARADTRDAVENPQPYIDINITGTINVFDGARAVGAKNVVFVSSSSVYGNSTTAPWQESAAADKPISPYGATKRAGELLAYAYHHNFGMPITCLRYFNVYGEHNRPTMVPYLWAQALLTNDAIQLSGAGTRRRDYTYVGDTVAATVAALRKPLGYEIINVGNNHPLSLTEFLAVFEKVIGVTAQVVKRESSKASVEETYADISKAKELLGWEPTTPLEEGVRKLVAWMRANRIK